MPQTAAINRRIVLVSRPRGRPTSADFRLEQVPVPTPRDGEVLVRTLYLSLDPYMRNVMDEGGTFYAPAVGLGEPVVGGTVNRVVASKHSQFRTGDLVFVPAGRTTRWHEGRIWLRWAIWHGRRWRWVGSE